jgi:hypothetical protein
MDQALRFQNSSDHDPRCNYWHCRGSWMYVVAIKDTNSWIGDLPVEICHDRNLESYRRLAQRYIYTRFSLTLYCLVLTVLKVAHSFKLEIFPGMGFTSS